MLTPPPPRASVSPTKTGGQERPGSASRPTHQDLVETRARKEHIIDELSRDICKPKQKPHWQQGVRERASPACPRGPCSVGVWFFTGEWQRLQKAILRDNS